MLRCSNIYTELLFKFTITSHRIEMQPKSERGTPFAYGSLSYSFCMGLHPDRFCQPEFSAVGLHRATSFAQRFE